MGWAYQLRGIVSLGSRSGHFFATSGIIGLTSDKLEGLGDKLLTVVRHCELIEELALRRGDFSWRVDVAKMELGALDGRFECVNVARLESGGSMPGSSIGASGLHGPMG